MNRITPILIALCTWGLAGAGGAEPTDPSFDQRMLEALREQGAISQSQYEELSRAAGAEQQSTTPAVSAAQDEPESWKAYWKDGLRVERNDGLFKLKFGGRVHVDAAFIEPENDLNDWATANLGEDLRGFGAELRRARLFMEGSFFEHGVFKAQYDFAGEGVSIKDLWVGLQKLPGVGRVRVGHFKEAFGLEEMTSTKYVTFMERALPIQAFAPSRNIGVAFDDTAFGERMTWAVGGFTENVDDANRDRSNFSDYNVTARITGLPIYADAGRTLVHFGAAYSHKFIHDENPIAFDGREVHLSEDLVDTGDIMADDSDLLGVEFASLLGPFSLQAEWMSAWVNPTMGSHLHFMGAYALASWFVTGEHRPYNTGGGSFGRVKPERSFAPGKGDWGALELAARYSYLDLSDEQIRGGTQNNVSVGANWYLYSNLRFMLNWVHSHLNGVGDQNAVQGRISLDF